MLRRNRFGGWYFDADKGGSGAGGIEGGSGGDDVLRGLQNLLGKHNDNANDVAKLLYTDNYELRDQIRTLKEQLPPAGAIVLAGDDVAAWEAYRALGAPDALTTALEEKDQAQGELATLRRASVLREAAEATGYNANVLTNLDREALAYELREQTQDGKTVKIAYVKDGEGDAVPLSQYAEQHWTDFLPALRPEESRRAPGTPFPRQSGHNGTPPSTNPAKEYLSRMYGGEEK